MINKVVVFGASGRQGLAQVRCLLSEGMRVRAVTRSAAFQSADYFGVQTVSADYNDPASLRTACEGADAVFYNAVTFSEASKGLDFTVNVARAAKAASVQRLIFNTASYVPDQPVGEPGYDIRLMMENILAEQGPPLTVFRPVIFMDNLLTGWARPSIAQDNELVYSHRPDLEANWICLDDVAAYMTKALAMDSLVGERIVIGGPERITPLDITQTLSEVLDRPISYRPISPRAFGEKLFELFSSKTDISKSDYVDNLESYYEFNNHSPIRPFEADLDQAKALIEIPLTPFKRWAQKQDWSMPDLSQGPSGG